MNVRGFNAGSSVGGDYEQLPQAQQDQIKNDPLHESSGSSAGLGINASPHLGFHFRF